ncbi:hypothetical protein TWF694_002647 [Orbilia ellipsospora]|uniref:Uncharacterized protein n=1 Tax=Orbilia ellipsospora TaxID=2528407 RepID=A0AAV9X2M5_9PEZI
MVAIPEEWAGLLGQKFEYMITVRKTPQNMQPWTTLIVTATPLCPGYRVATKFSQRLEGFLKIPQHKRAGLVNVMSAINEKICIAADKNASGSFGKYPWEVEEIDDMGNELFVTAKRYNCDPNLEVRMEVFYQIFAKDPENISRVQLMYFQD